MLKLGAIGPRFRASCSKAASCSPSALAAFRVAAAAVRQAGLKSRAEPPGSWPDDPPPAPSPRS